MQLQNGEAISHKDISAEDIAVLLQSILRATDRIEKIELPSATVWMKRQGTEKPIWWRHLQESLSKLLPYAFMRPSKILDAEGMNQREINAIEAFALKGFTVPEIIYRAPRVVVVKDVGPSIADRMGAKRLSDPAGHEALIVQSVEALGEIHGAGLCHGRPHVRDFFLKDGKIGFLDFEECPQEVMPLVTAQARDLWLLLLPLSTLSLDVHKTLPQAFDKWCLRAPAATQDELRQMIAVLGRFLPIVRLIGRVRMGSDLRRFILATEFLKTALETDVALLSAGKAGKDDRT
jgi:tRNA A-37 threonylcarbamoyl transferase component Bud32